MVKVVDTYLVSRTRSTRFCVATPTRSRLHRVYVNNDARGVSVAQNPACVDSIERLEVVYNDPEVVCKKTQKTVVETYREKAALLQ